MSGPTAYSVLGYGEMISCEPRMSAYARALREAVTPGCTVIDIGAGTGIFSVLACEYGAGKVIAIESNDAIELIHEAARAHGHSDRIEVFQGLSTDYKPQSKADVIVSDIRGCLPLFEHHIATVVDARTRLLAASGSMIPQRDRLQIALVESAKTYKNFEQPWLSNDYGVNLAAGHRYAVNTQTKVRLKPSDLISPTRPLAELDYRAIKDADMESTVELIASRHGTAHGFLLWFDAELIDGVGFSNAPGEPELIYGQSFFPFERPIGLAAGDRVKVRFKASWIDDTYVWNWNSALYRNGGNEAETQYSQSSFLSKVMSARSLRRRAADYVPQPRPSQAVDLHCLSMIDGQRSLEQIATELRSRFPETFPNFQKALDHATRVATRYD